MPGDPLRSDMKWRRKKRRWIKRARKQGISLFDYLTRQLLKERFHAG